MKGFLVNRLFIGLFLVTGTLCGVDDPWDTVRFTHPQKILRLYQVFKDIHELFSAFDIEYWVDGGTLLGAVRHKGIILWDDDIDLCIAKKHEQRLLRLKPLLAKLGYKLVVMPFGYTIKSPQAFLDLFFMDNKKGKYIYADKNTQTFFAKRDGGPIYYTHSELFPLKLYPFGDLKVWGPQDPIPYLNNYFKDWQTTAKFLIHHSQYDSKVIKLTPKYLVPAKPFGPLEDRVAQFL